MDFDFESGKRRDAVDAAGGEENKSGIPALAGFEQVDGTAEVVLDELTGTRFAVDPGEDAGIRGGVDDPFEEAESFQVGGAADVAVEDLDAAGGEPFAVQPRAGAGKVVDTDNLKRSGIDVIEQGLGQGGAYKTADASDEKFQYFRFKISVSQPSLRQSG